MATFWVTYARFPLLKEIQPLYGEGESCYDLGVADGSEVAPQIAREIEEKGSSLLVVSIASLDHLRPLSDLYIRLERYVQEGRLGLVLISSLAHPNLDHLLRKFQFLEVIAGSGTATSLKRRLDQHLKLLTALGPTSDELDLAQYEFRAPRLPKKRGAFPGKNRPRGTQLFQAAPFEAAFAKLAEAAALQSPVAMWTKGQALKCDSRVASYDSDREVFAMDYPLGWSAATLADQFKRVKPEMILWNFKPSRASLFFALSPADVSFRPDQVEFRAPELIYEVQRRKDFRLIFPDAIVRNIRTERGLFSLTDLSAGGAGFTVDLARASEFKVGDQIGEVRLDLESDMLVAQARVTWQLVWKTSMKRSVQKVGIEFSGLSAEAKKFLKTYVHQKHYEYYLAHLEPRKEVRF
jgi:hypothetical protein